MLYSLFSVISPGASSEEKHRFFLSLRNQFSAGVGLPEAVDRAFPSAKSGNLRGAIKRMSRFLHAGMRLDEVMKKESVLFAPVEVSLVRIGLDSGTLEGTLTMLAEQSENRACFLGHARSLMVRPLVNLFMAILLFEGVLIWIAEDRYGAAMSMVTGTLIPAVAVVVGLAGLLATLLWLRLVPYLGLLIDAIVAFIPFYSKALRDLCISQYLKVFSMLLAAGLELREAIELAGQSSSNRLWTWRFSYLTPAFDEVPGFAFSRWRRVGWMDAAIYGTLDSAFEAGKLDGTASKLAEGLFESAERRMRTLVDTVMPWVTYPAVAIVVIVWQAKLISGVAHHFGGGNIGEIVDGLLGWLPK